MANKKSNTSTSKKTSNSKTKKEVKETKKVVVEEDTLATDFVEEKKKKPSKKKVSENTQKQEKIKPEKKVEKEIKEEKIEETSKMDTDELNKLLGNDGEEERQPKAKKHTLVHFFLIILLFVSLGSFAATVLNKSNTVFDLISGLLLTIFTILFVTISISYHRKSKGTILLSGLLLLAYFLLNLNSHTNIVSTPISTVKDFQGKSITEVIKWASKNNIKINQEYEYSDMIEEYSVISQDIQSGTNLSKVKEITVAVSEGPNPNKEIIVPSMITWDDERVIDFVKNNYLSNVIVEFVESDKTKDTVIEQSASGNLKRSDELKLTFSFGEELGFSEVKLIDFTNKSKFEVEFYMKQHQLLYEFDSDFSKKVKRGLAMKQTIEAGETVHVNGEVIGVTISKGPKVKIPDLKNMSLEEITEWAIKNKVKLTFTDQYDESIKENDIISVNQEVGAVVEQGTIIKVVLSRGALKMPKFKSLVDFYNWANKYNINYEEKHEFSDTVKAGEIIKFSYKTGESIKNNDTITVIISDGEKQSVPNVVGLTKNEAISKLEKAGLNYSLVYEASSRTKNKVIDQSISAGSEVSRGTTVTITISTGEEDSYVEERKESNNTHNNNSNNNTKPKPPANNCSNVTVYIYPDLISNVPSTTCSNIKGAYPKLKFSCSYVKDGGLSNGMLKNASSIDEKTKSTCETISLVIVNNN